MSSGAYCQKRPAYQQPSKVMPEAMCPGLARGIDSGLPSHGLDGGMFCSFEEVRQLDRRIGMSPVWPQACALETAIKRRRSLALPAATRRLVGVDHQHAPSDRTPTIARWPRCKPAARPIFNWLFPSALRLRFQLQYPSLGLSLGPADLAGTNPLPSISARYLSSYFRIWAMGVRDY